MTVVTSELHGAFLAALGDTVERHSDKDVKPVDVDLRFPLPARIRAYVYSLVAGTAKRNFEYKAVLRVPGQPIGAYGSFEHAPDRFTILIAYCAALDVFVLWDASMHFRFKNGGNIQVKQATVIQAACSGRSSQDRELSDRRTETVLACQSATLAKVLVERLALTG